MNLALTRNAAIAALILGTAQSVLAETTYNDAVIFGKVSIAKNGSETDPYLSVTIPATEGAVDVYGNPTTIWNLGTVMAGSVYDSFYNGGPGYFRVQNTGNLPAYVYVSTGLLIPPQFLGYQYDNNNYPVDLYYQDTSRLLFGEDEERAELEPVALPKFMDQLLNEGAEMAEWSYALAVSTEITGLVPVWRPLSWLCYHNEAVDSLDYKDCAEALRCEDGGYTYLFPQGSIGGRDFFAYLAYMPIGETQLFDLKFWAPLKRNQEYNKYWFPIRIEASAFRLWDHDR